MKKALVIALKAAAVVAAFFLGVGASRLLGSWGAYCDRGAGGESGGSVCRAAVERVLDEAPETRRVELRLLSGPFHGKIVPASQAVGGSHPLAGVRAGEHVLAVVRPAERATSGSAPSSASGLFAEVVCRERDGVLLGMACALAVLMGLLAGRKGLAAVASAVWCVALLLGVLLPAALRGAHAAAWCVPLTLAIAVPTLLAIGGRNRKSLGAIGGTLCGVVAGGVVSMAFTRAMVLTGLETEFGLYHHLENLLWYAPALSRVDFGSLLVAGMLLAGLGAVMDVSMAVASTVSEVRGAAPRARFWELVRPGLGAGREILGIMVLTLGLVYVGSHLVFFVSVGRTGWASRWLQLGNYEELAAELARMAAAAIGMAACVPATALFTALLARRKPVDSEQWTVDSGQKTVDSGQKTVDRGRRPGSISSAVHRLLSTVYRPLPLVSLLACAALAGLADERGLRSYLPARGQAGGDTVARVVDFDEPAVSSISRSTNPHARRYFASQIAVIQPELGPSAGELLPALITVGSNPANNLVLRRGALVQAAVGTDGAGVGTLVNKIPLRYRWGLVALLAVAATLALGAGSVGLRVILAMGATAALMFEGLIPLLAQGRPPVLMACGFCAAMLSAVFVVSGSVGRKALAACAGCALGVAAAAGLCALSSGWLRFTGSESVGAQFLSWIAERAGTTYDYSGLLTATLLVVLFGLVLDTAVTIAAGVAQVCSARADITRGEAIAAGVAISGDVVGTMALTLVFAFVGLRLPVFLLPAATGLSPAEFVNGEAGAAELVQALVGVAALAVTGLATALIAGGWMAGGGGKKTVDSGQWTVDSGKREEESGQRTVDSGQCKKPRSLLSYCATLAVALAALAAAGQWWTLRRERLAKASLPVLPQGEAELIAAGRQAALAGRTGHALVALWAARSRFPGHAEARTELAYVYMTNRWVEQARREIEAALDAGADDAKTHYVAGVVYAWLGQQDDAEAHLRAAVQRDPANAAAKAALESLFGE